MTRCFVPGPSLCLHSPRSVLEMCSGEMCQPALMESSGGLSLLARHFETSMGARHRGAGCYQCRLGWALRFGGFRFKSQWKARNAMVAPIASPPITPPAIAPEIVPVLEV